MILECPSCHARYLVQIGSFAGGGRHVRCARCRHQWHAFLPTTIDVFQASDVPDIRFPPGLEGGTSPLSSSPSTPLSQPDRQGSEGDSNLPAVVSHGQWGLDFSLLLNSLIVIAKVSLLLLVIVVWPVLDRQQIAEVIPALKGAYEFLGLPINHTGAGLVFNQVKSEIKYDSGMMRLVVDGIVHNTTDDMQIIPDIKARALGPDSHIIQSWWVPAPAATVAAGGDVPFHTEVNASTQKTIDDVYLEFYPQDEKGNAAQ